MAGEGAGGAPRQMSDFEQLLANTREIERLNAEVRTLRSALGKARCDFSCSHCHADILAKSVNPGRLP